MIFEFFDAGIQPQSKKLRVLLEENQIISAGYTRNDINEMTMDEYESVLMIINIKKQKEYETKAKTMGI